MAYQKTEVATAGPIFQIEYPEIVWRRHAVSLNQDRSLELTARLQPHVVSIRLLAPMLAGSRSFVLDKRFRRE
jgi:hypothetical protein